MYLSVFRDSQYIVKHKDNTTNTEAKFYNFIQVKEAINERSYVIYLWSYNELVGQTGLKCWSLNRNLSWEITASCGAQDLLTLQLTVLSVSYLCHLCC